MSTAVDCFALNVRRLRQERGMTLRELGKRSGVAFSYLNSIEGSTGRNPSLRHAVNIASAFGVPLEEMLRTPPPDPACADAEGGERG